MRWPRGVEALGTSPPARWSQDLHKRGVGAGSRGFCCDVVGVRCGDLSQLERNQKPSVWHCCGRDAATCQRCRCDGQPCPGRKRGCRMGSGWEDARSFSLVTERGGEAPGKYWGERIAFKPQITLAHKQMGINWWGLPGGWEICGGDYMTWLLRIAGVGLNDPAGSLWSHPPLTTPGAPSSSRAGLFVFEYYDVKQVKMSKAASKRCCAFSVPGMCQETLLHQLWGSSPACQRPAEAQGAVPQATEMLEGDAGEK